MNKEAGRAESVSTTGDAGGGGGGGGWGGGGMRKHSPRT